jgi:hypothetical protein
MLLWRGAAALILVCLLALAKLGVSRLAARADVERQPGQAIAAGMILGGPPADFVLAELVSAVRVDGVIDLGTPSVAEQVTAASLHLAYLYLAMPGDGSPTRSQLRVLAGFVHAHTVKGYKVYMNDDGSGGLMLTTAAMLLMTQGQSWPSISARMTPAQLHSICSCQLRAIHQLSVAVAASAGHPLAGGRP